MDRIVSYWIECCESELANSSYGVVQENLGWCNSCLPFVRLWFLTWSGGIVLHWVLSCLNFSAQINIMICAGQLLDSFARQHLWQIGLDYLHGTGHGVGSFLNVHEGWLSVSSRSGIVMFVVTDVNLLLSCALTSVCFSPSISQLVSWFSDQWSLRVMCVHYLCVSLN